MDNNIQILLAKVAEEKVKKDAILARKQLLQNGGGGYEMGGEKTNMKQIELNAALEDVNKYLHDFDLDEAELAAAAAAEVSVSVIINQCGDLCLQKKHN